METIKIVIKIPKKSYDVIKSGLVGTHSHNTSLLCSWIKNGTPLPEGAEILTAEAYSDLCLRASRSIEWHPYPQEKPSVIGYYLVTTDGTSNDVIDIAWFDAEMAGLLQWNKASDILAWAYLPKPYEEGSKE